MKNIHLKLVAVFALIACSGRMAAVSSYEAGTDAAAECESIASGVVRIRISPEAPALSVGSFAPGMAETGNPGLDQVLNSLRATRIRHVFSDGGKFAERRRRYGLHLWYDIEIDKNIPVSKAVESLSQVDVVEYAGPVYLAEPASDSSELRYHGGKM